MKSIYQLFQLPLQLLIKELTKKASLNEQKSSPTLTLELEYCRGLAAYLAGDNNKLLEIINRIKMIGDDSNQNLKDTLIIILDLRLLVRKKNLSDLQLILSKIKSQPQNLISENYLGEYHFVLARGHEILSNYEHATYHYTQAAFHYQKQRLNKKHLKSLFNAMVNREYMTETIVLEKYHQLLAMAIQERDRSILGCILQNLSFQLLFAGAYNSALKFSKHSLSILRFEGDGLNYQLAELNLAHLYYLLGYFTELKKLEGKFESSQYPEIRAGIQLLKTSNFTENKELYSLGWSWRLHKRISSLPKLSELEDKLMGYLVLSPRTRVEIISYLWPRHIDKDAANDRFKKVLARLKTKRSRAVLYSKPFYRLVINDINKSKDVRENLKIHMVTSSEVDLIGDELKVRDILSSGSYNFYELMEKIYGTAGSVDKLTNRLKNLLGRIRKKYPNRLHFREGKYYWI